VVFGLYHILGDFAYPNNDVMPSVLKVTLISCHLMQQLSKKMSVHYAPLWNEVMKKSSNIGHF
jgi:hypothetical protein